MAKSISFNGNNYSIELNEDGWFVVIKRVSEKDLFDSFEELVEAHPICEEARDFFFGSYTPKPRKNDGS